MLKGLVILRCAYLADDPIGKKQFAEATKLVIRDYPGDAEEFARAIRDVREPARRAYRTLLEGKIKPARIVILPDFTPALRCPSLSVAMFAFAAYRGVVVCPNCQKLFAVDSERVDGSASERYCTVACGSRYRQKVYRLNAKREKRKRKGKR
jgi:hypothetical protein